MTSVTDAVTLSGAEHGLSLLRLLGALGVVLVAFWVFARVMRALNGSASGSSAGLNVVGSLSLGQRERLVVLDAGDERIVLGITAHTITRVHAMPTPPEAALQASTATADGSVGTAFADRLRAALQRTPS